MLGMASCPQETRLDLKVEESLETRQRNRDCISEQNHVSVRPSVRVSQVRMVGVWHRGKA